MKTLTVKADIDCFPSDNKFDRLNKNERIQMKGAVKALSRGCILESLQAQGIKHYEITGKSRPPYFQRMAMRVTFFYCDLIKRDIHNHSIKQFTDQLKDLNFIKDDNYCFIPEVHFVFGGHAAKSHALVQMIEYTDEEVLPDVQRAA